MSHSASLADYRAALTAPGARGPVLASLLARLPIAMIGLALLFYVQRTTGSFAIAGLVSAGALVGVASGAVVQGRVMDRLGPTRPLMVTTGLFGLLTTVAIVAVESAAATPLLVVLAAFVGLSEPMVGAASRAVWPSILPPGPVRHAAYAYEAISLEVFFILGPSLAGVLIAAPWAGTGFVVGAASMIVGSVWFANTRTVRSMRPQAKPFSLLGAIATPGMRTVVLAAFGFGVTIGFVEVAVPAAATAAGYATIGGLLLGAWSVSSVVFGLFYGARPWPRPIYLRAPVLLGGFGVLVALISVAGPLWLLALLLLLAGTLVTPQATTHSALIENVAPPGTVTEAFGWIVTAVTLGLAIGQSTSGQLAEYAGTGWSFLVGGVAGVIIGGLVWLRRHTLAEPGPVAPVVEPALVVGGRG